MVNTFNTKTELVNFMIEMISHPHIQEDFRKNLMNEDDDMVLYILNNLIDNHTNNIMRISDEQYNLYEEFRNNVFCRNENNQHKAKKLWNQIKTIIDDSDKALFNTEWNHYMMGDMELDVNGFSLYFDKYVKKYYKK